MNLGQPTIQSRPTSRKFTCAATYTCGGGASGREDGLHIPAVARRAGIFHVSPCEGSRRPAHTDGRQAARPLASTRVAGVHVLTPIVSLLTASAPRSCLHHLARRSHACHFRKPLVGHSRLCFQPSSLRPRSSRCRPERQHRPRRGFHRTLAA